MEDCELESLAVKEIIEEIERNKRTELESQRPPQRQVRPNKRFLGRTIVSALQHNRRQYAQEKRNSYRKLRELDKKRRRSRSKEDKHRRVRQRSIERYQDVEVETFPNGMQNDLTMYFLSNVNQLLKNVQNIPKKAKKRNGNSIRTIDLTKKKKHGKKKNEKQKLQSKTIKSKKRRRRKDSSSSMSSSSVSVCALSDSESNNSDGSQSATLLIDLT